MSASLRQKIINDFNQSETRLLLLDYDGTLVPFARHPQMAKPTDELLKTLKRLSEDKKTDTVIISGRDKDTLFDWFGMFNFGLVAEHGAFIKEKNKPWEVIKPLSSDWHPQILAVMQKYVDRIPASFIEKKEFSLAWHYRKTAPESGALGAKELVNELVPVIANINVEILQGNKVIEVRNKGVSKGDAALYWIAKKDFDFVLAIGDDRTDEDLFKVIPETAYSIKVGMDQSFAISFLRNYKEVIELIQVLLK